jgi:DNA primase
MTDVQLIKDRVDIVQLIQEYVPLKKAGVNWKAPCPFHQEKSPSFMVNPEKQIWHCFGCNKGGDVFSFLEQIEGLEFTESLTLLARRAGVELTNNFSSKINQTERNRMQEINAKAAYFFNHFLLEIPASQIARDYLKRRNVQDQTLLDWQIGYIPDQWDLLTRYLLKKGYSTTDLVNAGLVIKREGADEKTGRGFYDRFRGRVMFPICDLHGAVVGFTGRVLVETEKSGGKYVNSPQTMIYDKSRLLYGLDKAKTAIKAKGIAIIVEGQMDVISCHQMGMKNVVAASGTALTPEQIKLLKRYCTTVAMALECTYSEVQVL